MVLRGQAPSPISGESAEDSKQQNKEPSQKRQRLSQPQDTKDILDPSHHNAGLSISQQSWNASAATAQAVAFAAAVSAVGAMHVPV